MNPLNGNRILLPCILCHEVDGLESVFGLNLLFFSILQSCLTVHFVAGFHLYVSVCFHPLPKGLGAHTGSGSLVASSGCKCARTGVQRAVFQDGLHVSRCWCLVPQLEDFQCLLFHKLDTYSPGQVVSFAVNWFMYN